MKSRLWEDKKSNNFILYFRVNKNVLIQNSCLFMIRVFDIKSNFFKVCRKLQIRIANLTSNFKKVYLVRTMPQLRGLFSYDTKQSMKDEIEL